MTKYRDKIKRDDKVFRKFRTTSRSILYKNKNLLLKKCLVVDGSTKLFFENYEKVYDVLKCMPIFTRLYRWHDKQKGEYVAEYFPNSKILPHVELTDVVKSLILDILKAIVQLHQKGYQYSALQCSNILISNKIVKLCDVDAVRPVSKRVNIKKLWPHYSYHFLDSFTLRAAQHKTFCADALNKINDEL